MSYCYYCLMFLAKCDIHCSSCSIPFTILTGKLYIQCSLTYVCSLCCYWALLIFCVQLICRWIRPSLVYSLFPVSTHINFEEPTKIYWKSYYYSDSEMHLCITVIVQLGTHGLPWTMIKMSEDLLLSKFLEHLSRMLWRIKLLKHSKYNN